MIITPQQMTQAILQALDDAVQDYPEDERDAAKAAVLEAFGAELFNMPMRDRHND